MPNLGNSITNGNLRYPACCFPVISSLNKKKCITETKKHTRVICEIFKPCWYLLTRYSCQSKSSPSPLVSRNSFFFLVLFCPSTCPSSRLPFLSHISNPSHFAQSWTPSPSLGSTPSVGFSVSSWTYPNPDSTLFLDLTESIPFSPPFCWHPACWVPSVQYSIVLLFNPFPRVDKVDMYLDGRCLNTMWIASLFVWRAGFALTR